MFPLTSWQLFGVFAVRWYSAQCIAQLLSRGHQCTYSLLSDEGMLQLDWLAIAEWAYVCIFVVTVWFQNQDQFRFLIKHYRSHFLFFVISQNELVWPFLVFLAILLPRFSNYAYYVHKASFCQYVFQILIDINQHKYRVDTAQQLGFLKNNLPTNQGTSETLETSVLELLTRCIQLFRDPSLFGQFSSISKIKLPKN